MKSWYKFDESSLTSRQEKVLELMESLFWIRTASGSLIPYIMTPYQKHFHSRNIMSVPKEEWRDRIMVKSRGIGASTIVLIDFLSYIIFGFESVTFPIASYSAPASNDLIRKAIQIIRDTEEQNKVDLHCRTTATSVINDKTNSELRAIPANDKAFRRFRAPALFMDEFAFAMHGEELYSGAKPVMSEGGQMTLASTVMSFNDPFMNTVNKFKEGDLGDVFELPLFSQSDFNPAKSLLEQKGIPIAPWFDLNKLEKDRRENPEKFMREHQITPVDESLKFYPYPLLLNCADLDTPVLLEEVDGPYRVMGMDVASIKDFASFVEFTKVGDIWYNTFVDKQKIPYPELEEYTRNLISQRKPIRFNIDRTGAGEHLFQKIQREFGSIVNGFHFSARIDKQKIREYAAYHLRILMLDGKIKLSRDDDLIKHLNSWDATLSKVTNRKEHHGDLAIAAELAVFPEDKIPREKTKKTVSGAFGMGKRFGGQTVRMR